MKMRQGLVAGWCLTLILGASVAAQEPEGPTGQPTPPAPAAPPLMQDDRSLRIALYVEVGIGGGQMKDPLETSVETVSTKLTTTEFELTDHSFAQAAIGWKLAEGKGDFRLMFNGFREEEYELDSVALDAFTKSSPTPNLSINLNCIQGQGLGAGLKECLVPWWTLRLRDGKLDVTQLSPFWKPSNVVIDPMDGSCTVLDGNDANCNGLPDPEEVLFNAPGQEPIQRPTLTVPKNLDNHTQLVDLVYGREFGGRRFSSRWWGGVRYFEYRGTALGTAWLNASEAGSGFTDGSFLKLLQLHQETTGYGPTGSWEASVNFFDKGLKLFIRGQAAFMFNSLELDTGEFFTIVNPNVGATVLHPARLTGARDKSSWQTTAEAGVRLQFRNGLKVHVSMNRTGFLDVALLPTEISIAEDTSALTQATALSSTQDIVIDTWRTSIGFQF